jgi:hypothetical protein
MTNSFFETNATWDYLHDVQTALIAKINATGQKGFTIAKQAAIYSFATDPTQIKLDHSTTKVFEYCFSFVSINLRLTSVIKRAHAD